MKDNASSIVENMPMIPVTDQSASEFAESYASFNRIINALQRKYIELREEFTAQNEQLAEANRKLVGLTESNLAANKFLFSIFDAMPVGVITVDRQGVVTHLNPAGAIMFNRNARLAIGMHYYEIIPDKDKEFGGALKAMQSGQGASSAEKNLTLGDNRKLRVSVSSALLQDEAGNCVGAVEVIQNLTKIRDMEHEIARLNVLAALGEMAATIAHEVRNPLAGIGGFAALLERDINPADPKILLVQKIKKGVDTLNQTVTKLLNYTRFNELNRIETDYVHFLKGVVEQFRHEQNCDVPSSAITFTENKLTKPNDLIAVIDKLLFRQCLFNFFTNSVEASGENAKINISLSVYSTSNLPACFANKINLDFDEALLVTTISDNGPGIKPEHCDKIFAPFFTTKSGGSGLGLAVAWKLIKAHGGEIVLGENSEDGATFHILLPARLGNTQLEIIA